MVQAYEDALNCECFVTGESCVCEDDCECGCPDCVCQELDEETPVGGCACGGNCMCNISEDEENEGGLL